ncbi:class A beta-lactamase [Kosakonia cowanii]
MHLPAKSFLALLLLGASAANAATIDAATLTAIARLQEEKLHARIGIAVIDTASGKSVSYRGDERFPLNSTHKALLCGALLSKVDRGEFALSDTTQFSKETLVDYSPVTSKFVEPKSMSWQQVCSAAIEYSDNTAANLVAQKLGGPQKVTAWFAGLGDNVTRLDRKEPELNSAVPGDLQDTTTPLAVSRTLEKLTLGDALKPESRAQLVQWMKDDKVADALLRASLPSGWKIGDKTGAGAHGSRSIISVVWPKKGQPIIVSVYITQTEATLAQSNDAIARIGKSIFEATR